jgi:hypothetical protein
MVDRWHCPPLSTQKPEPDGPMVYYVDYEKLETENAELRVEIAYYEDRGLEANPGGNAK